MNKAFLAAFLIIIDQISKLSVLKRLHQSESIPILNNIFHITLVYNTGSAFGLFRNQNIIFTYISIFAIISIILFLIRRPKFDSPLILQVWQIALVLILSGAAGNLIDRLRLGYVIDFLDFRIWPVFNFADTMISMGVMLLLFIFFRREKSL